MYRREFSRRDFLKLGGAGLAGAAMLGTAGCGGGGSSSDALSFTFWGTSFEDKSITDMAKKFHDSHPEIQVDVQHIANTQYDAKLNSQVAANDAPDLAYLNVGMTMRLGEQSKLVNIVDHFDEFPNLADRIPESYLFWAPGKATNTLALATMNLWYNKDIFEKAGVDPPPTDAAKAWTWDEFVETAQKLTVDQNGNLATDSGFDPKSVKQYGVWLPSLFGQASTPMLLSNGGSMTNEDGTKFALDSPESIEVHQAIQDLMHKYYVSPGPAQRQGEAPTSIAQLQSGRAAMAWDGQWVLLDLGQTDLNYGIGVLPKFKKALTTVGGAGAGIFKSTSSPKKAMTFYLYYNDPQNVPMFSDGLWMPLEEKYYTEEKYINMWTDNDLHPEGYKQASLDYLLNYGVPDPGQRIKNLDQINNKLEPGMDPIWSGKKPAKEVLTGLKSQIDPLLKGLYPDPRKELA